MESAAEGGENPADRSAVREDGAGENPADRSAVREDEAGEGPADRSAVGDDGEEPEDQRAGDAVQRCPQPAWLEVELVDPDGSPVPDLDWEVELPDGEVRRGKLDTQGRLRLDDIPAGICLVSLPGVEKYAQQPALPRTAWIELELRDERGAPIPAARYEIECADGTTRTGELDEQGHARVEEIPAGLCTVEFPDLDAAVFEHTDPTDEAAPVAEGEADERVGDDFDLDMGPDGPVVIPAGDYGALRFEREDGVFSPLQTGDEVPALPAEAEAEAELEAEAGPAKVPVGQVWGGVRLWSEGDDGLEAVLIDGEAAWDPWS